MTFYWWSHWFWITVLGSLHFLVIVQTYPSQELTSEYNQNSKSEKSVTKLFQTASSTTWTISPTSTQIIDITQGDTVMAAENAEDKETEIDENEDEEIETQKLEKQQPVDDDVEEVDGDVAYMNQNSDDYEFKRSAENDSNRTDKPLSTTNETRNEASAIKVNKKPTITMAEDDSLGGSIMSININNDQNFSNNNFNNLSTNSRKQNITFTSSTNSSTPPSTPHIDTETAATEWLNTAVVPPPVSQSNIENIVSNLVTATSASQRAPFTLENVNKEDELRRAESEHRTRKSKVLSAEYKHINRYINYSSDSKSLLARSASASPNEFVGDSESNISSEALAVQRTYFLDAGAISAICFTVFGVCCTVGTIGIVLYRRRYLNKPHTLSEPDSSVYIDDSTMRVSDNSDEMYSLDNDSFLNSLEAMTIQNYWTDTVKHTKL